MQTDWALKPVGAAGAFWLPSEPNPSACDVLFLSLIKLERLVRQPSTSPGSGPGWKTGRLQPDLVEKAVPLPFSLPP